MNERLYRYSIETFQIYTKISRTSTSIIIGDVARCNGVGSIEHEQLAVFGYSLGNDGLIRLRPFDDVILCFEHRSTTDESEKEENKDDLFGFVSTHY